MKTYISFFATLFVCLLAICALGQVQVPRSESDEARVNELFKKANSELESKEYGAALKNYLAALEISPGEPALLYNGGFAALLNKDAETASKLLVRLKKLDPDDWQGRVKLIQAYQILGNLAERNKEREELFALHKNGKNKELKEQVQYCRDRFDAAGKTVLAFELFEFKASWC